MYDNAISIVISMDYAEDVCGANIVTYSAAPALFTKNIQRPSAG